MLNIPGLISIIVFYFLILIIGLCTARRTKKQNNLSESEDSMLAGRSIGACVGFFTLTATWVGGGYINGTAEYLYTSGLVWCQAPVGYALSLLIGGIFFAKKMREKLYVTMLDPFQEKFGTVMGGFLFIPALFGEVFWTAAILSALGSTLRVILDINFTIAVIMSACIAVVYTFFGGLYSVAYTDIVQLTCILFGLVFCIPFAMMNSAVSPIFSTYNGTNGTLITGATNGWLGTLDSTYAFLYADSFLLLILGGMPWQAYFQRVLGAKSPNQARLLSCIAAIGCFVMAIPPILIGAIAKSTDWTKTEYASRLENGTNTIPTDDHKLVLPLVLQYLTPVWVSFFGLGAVSAAVMSSADSSVLSASSMFTNNIYRAIIRPKASSFELLWILRGCIVVVGALATVLGITIQSVYGLWFLSSDLVYCILFPQLVSVIYLPFTNVYGSIAGYIVGWVLRLLGGEPLIGLPPAIKYPYYNSDDGQLFPFKTLTMLLSFTTIIFVSGIMYVLHSSGAFTSKQDRLYAFHEKDDKSTSGVSNPALDDIGKETPL